MKYLNQYLFIRIIHSISLASLMIVSELSKGMTNQHALFLSMSSAQPYTAPNYSILVLRSSCCLHVVLDVVKR